MKPEKNALYCQDFFLKYKQTKIKASLCLVDFSLVELKETIPSFLHPTEFEHLKTLNYEKRQHDYLLGHLAAKKAASQYSHLLPTEMYLESGFFLQPLLHSATNEKIQVSYSHTHHYAIAIAFPENYPMGIDLEKINIEKQTIISTQMTDDDKKWISTIQSDHQEKNFTLFWTMKEALSKALRTGMTTPFEILSIENIKSSSNESWTSVFNNFKQYQALSFFIHDLACSIVFPKQVEIIIDIPSLKNSMMRL